MLCCWKKILFSGYGENILKVSLIDTKICNLNSVVRALTYCGLEFEILNDASSIKHSSRLILPGVGSFKTAMQHLNENGFSDEIFEHVKVKQRPILGICLGMQLLSDYGEEEGGANGLRLIARQVVKLSQTDLRYKVPNIGWCKVSFSKQSSLYRDIQNLSSFYHVHSYYFQCASRESVNANIEFSSEKICVGVSQNNVFGVQFHPEKSHASGLQIFKNFFKV